MFESGIAPPSLGKWDRRFLELACTVGKWSKDPSTRVGAVIANTRRVVSLGFNGFPAGVNDLDERYANRDVKYKMVVHAEANAIISAREPLSGCTLFVSAPPCATCAGKIIQTGITKVFYVASSTDFHDRWKQDLDTASIMFQEAGVTSFKLEEGWHAIM